MQNTVDEPSFVSRGGFKVNHALNTFQIDVTDFTVLDVGCSTGGFVDCLLQHGATKVYALDTAYGELSWKLRQDPRVKVMERTNVLKLTGFPEAVDLITIDASWTRLSLILPIVRNFLKPKGQIIALVKPHYEADKKLLVKGVLPVEVAEQVKEQVKVQIESLDLKVVNETPSPILGGGGNTEYLWLIHQ